MLWGMIITVATWHPYRKLSKLLGDRRTLAAVLVSMALLLILVVPISLLVDSLAEGVGAVAGLLRDLTSCACPSRPTGCATSQWSVSRSTPSGARP